MFSLSSDVFSKKKKVLLLYKSYLCYAATARPTWPTVKREKCRGEQKKARILRFSKLAAGSKVVWMIFKLED